MPMPKKRARNIERLHYPPHDTMKFTNILSLSEKSAKICKNLRIRFLLPSAFLLLPFLSSAVPVKLGLAWTSDAAKRDVEFQQYAPVASLYRKAGLEPSLMPREPFFHPGITREQMDALLAGYHAIHLETTEEQISKLTPEILAHAKMVSEALVHYVERGGGLFLDINPVRYPGMKDEEYWNIILKPLGIRILHEGVFDPTRTFEAVTMYGHQPEIFWATRNFVDPESPLLKGVKGLVLPRRSSDGTPGISAIEYSDAWNIIVRGEKEARSFRTPSDNNVQTTEVGAYAESPPVVATRALGEGRIVSYPLARVHAGMNHGNPIWPDIVESRGNPKKDWPSDSAQLQINAYHWLGGNAQKNAALGAHRIIPAVPIRYDKSKSWDNEKFGELIPRENAARGIFGARTRFGGGNGTVEEYVKAAKEAGLKFIVFSDPLEKLTPESLDALKKACAEASKEGDFYASPGIQFTDAAGIRWAIWGNDIIYPDKTFHPKNAKKTYDLWDGERILARGHYMDLCGQPGGAVLSYKQLRENKAHPENLWWFWHYFPRVYEDNKLVEDQFEEYLFGLRDLRSVSVVSYTGIDDPSKVAEAARLSHTNFPDLDSARKALNSHFERNIRGPWRPQFYMTEGPEILEWNVINPQMEENWQKTRGAQRVRLRLDVASDKGIRDVRIHDADRGIIRRFAGNGEKRLTREFEVVHDRRHSLVLEVTDTDGKKALSQDWRIFCYKQGLFRCGDNLNILGPLGMQWHPDRNQFFDAAKNFQNGMDSEVLGVDTSIAIVPMPDARLQDYVSIQGVGDYPTTSNSPGMTSKLMDVALSSHNLQIATMTLENLAQRFDTDERPGPSWGSSPVDVAENEYFRRTHRLISPMDRIDWFTAWNHRRGREGRKGYRGSFNWHEGEIEFKKDVTLQGAVPIPLVEFKTPFDPEKGWGTVFVRSPKEGEIEELPVRADQREVLKGTIVAGGFVSQLPSLVGYQAFFPAGEGTYAYQAVFSGKAGEPDRLVVGLGEDGQQIKAGTILKYRFAVGVFTDTEPNGALLGHTARALNFSGRDAGYPVKLDVGSLKDSTFFLRVQAAEGEAKFQAGPQKLTIDLPIVVEGLEDNGAVAAHSSEHPWFRFVPVVDGAAWLQESIDKETDFWVGNIFRADNKDIRLTVVVDGQNKGRTPFIEVHNPTEKPIKTTIRSPKHTPQFGGLTREVTVPAGSSIRLNVEDKALALQGEKPTE